MFVGVKFGSPIETNSPVKIDIQGCIHKAGNCHKCWEIHYKQFVKNPNRSGMGTKLFKAEKIFTFFS